MGASSVETIGVRLRRMILPQLRPGMRLGVEIGEQAQRRAVTSRWQDCARGEVDSEADDIVGRHPRAHRTQDLLEGFEPVPWML